MYFNNTTMMIRRINLPLPRLQRSLILPDGKSNTTIGHSIVLLGVKMVLFISLVKNVIEMSDR